MPGITGSKHRNLVGKVMPAAAEVDCSEAASSAARGCWVVGCWAESWEGCWAGCWEGCKPSAAAGCCSAGVVGCCSSAPAARQPGMLVPSCKVRNRAARKPLRSGIRYPPQAKHSL